MLKYLVLVCFLLATVSGQLQNPIPRGQLLTPVDQPQASQGLPAALRNGASSKPCRRRSSNVDNPDVLSPEGRWVQTFHSQTVHPLDQKVPREAVEVVETSRPSNEYTVSEETGHNTLADEDRYRDSNQTLEENENDDPVDNQDELCQKSDDSENDRQSVNKQTSNKNNLNPDSAHANEVQKQALKLLSKCVQKEKEANADVSEGNSRRSNNSNKPVENSYSYEPSKSNAEVRKRNRNRKLNANEIQTQLRHPAKGEGISSLADSKVLLIQNSRVCYACTTTNDPSCWNPGHTTTVKYCKKDDDACITKTVKSRNELITIRDCGNSCSANDPGVPIKYASCRICHSDLCNGADALNSLNILVVAFIISAIKYTF